MQRIVIIALSLGLSACSMLELNETKYSFPETASGIQQWYAEKKRAKFQEAKEQLGLGYTRDVGQNELRQIHQRIELNNLESQLDNRSEKAQYYSLKPYFQTDQERIEFLKQPNHIAKQRWADYRGIASGATNYSQQEMKLIENNDIAKDMSMAAVKLSWGEPDLKGSAGNSLYGNQSWQYRKLVSTENGYKEERRVIYFDSGRVVGWQTF